MSFSLKMFDPTMKKKKKKKKMPLDLDGIEGEAAVEEKTEAPTANDKEENEPKGMVWE